MTRARSVLIGILAIGSLAASSVARASDAPTPAESSAVRSLVAPDGLETEVIRPGIERVIGDDADHSLARVRHVAVAPDGTVWAATDNGRVFAIGQPGSFDPEVDAYPGHVADLIVLSDGTVVVHDGKRISGWDGSAWSPLGALAKGSRSVIRTVVEGPDGDLWLLLDGVADGPFDSLLAHLGDDGATYPTLEDLGIDADLGIEADAPVWATSLARTPDGAVWVGLAEAGPTAGGLVRYDGRSWSAEDPFGDGKPFVAESLEVGSDGVLTARLQRGRSDSLRHWDGTAWTVGPTPRASDGHASGPDPTEWPDDGWLRWWPRDGAIDYAFPGPFAEAAITDETPGPEGSMWVVLSVSSSLTPDDPVSGLYLIDPEAAAASLPAFRTVGRHGLVPLLDPHFATRGRGDGDIRARWAQGLGTDIVAEVFAVGDRWYAALDSVGPAGDRWIENNSRGTGSQPLAAIMDALRKEERVTFVDKAAQSALLEWPPPSPKKER